MSNEIAAVYEREFLRRIFCDALAPGPESEIARASLADARREWFTTPERQMIFDAMTGAVEAGHAPDSWSVYDFARANSFSDAISDEQRIIESHCPDAWPGGSAESVLFSRSAAWLASEADKRRRLLALEAASDGIRCGKDAEVAESIQNALESDLEAKSDVATLRDLLGAILSESVNPPAEQSGVIPMFEELAPYVGMLKPGSLTVLGGSPGDGKSSVMLEALMQYARTKERPFFISGEDPIETIQERLALKFAPIRSYDPTRITAKHRELIDAFYRLRASEQSWVGKPKSRGIADFRAQMRSAVTRYGATVIFVDYLQVIQAPGSDHERTSYCVNAIKEEAQQLNIPVVLGSQFNRAGRENGAEPFVSSIRGSGVVEEVAENILLLWRTGEWNRDPARSTERRHLKVAKAKSGRAGAKFNLAWSDNGGMCMGVCDFDQVAQGSGNTSAHPSLGARR